MARDRSARPLNVRFDRVSPVPRENAKDGGRSGRGGRRAGEGGAYGNLGNAYQSQGDYYAKAIGYHTQCFAIAKEVGDRAGEGKE